MAVYVVISSIALACYGGLFVLVLASGPKRSRSHQLFSLFLFVMVLLQVGYLMLSLANGEQMARSWYTFNVCLSAGKAVIFFWFTKAFLDQKMSPKPVRVGMLIWLLVVILGVILYPRVLFADIHRYAPTGLFVPELALDGVLFLLPIVVLWGWTAGLLSHAYRGAQSSLRRVRIQYVLAAVIIVWVGLAANIAPFLRPYPVDVIANIAGALLVAYAILRYRLLDINIVIRKGVLYAVSVAILGTIYFLCILIVARVFERLMVGMQYLLFAVIVAAIATLIVHPLRDCVHVWISRAFYRDAYDSNLMLQRLGHVGTSVLDFEKLAEIILYEVTTTMHIRWAGILIEQDAAFHLVVQKGTPTITALPLTREHPVVRWLSDHKTAMTLDVLNALLERDPSIAGHIDELKRTGVRILVPLRVRDALIGALVAGPKLSQQNYSQDDEVVLITLANQVSVAIDNARLYQAVRQELVERERVEASLRESEARYRLIAENVADIVWTGDMDLNLRYVSPAVTRMRGYAVEEAVGQRLDEIFTPASLTLGLQTFAEALAQEASQDSDPHRVWRLELEVYRRDGSTLWTENMMSFLRDADGSPNGIVGITHDISERKRAEAERESLIAELEAKNDELERFTYTVSHDLKSPLITIRGFLGFLEKDVASGDTGRITQDVQHIAAAVGAMQLRLNDLLTLSRIGRLDPQLQDVAMHDLVRDAVKLTSGYLMAHDVRVDIAPEMPVVRGDRSRLLEVFENLLGNAAKFMGDQPHPRVEVGVRGDGDQAVFYVRDNGIGIEPRHQERIFRLFEKIDAQAEGTGIGLAIVRRIIEKHAGRIWVESKGLGHGSTFYFTLPLKPDNGCI